ncbi:MAG: ATP-binding cassette domain-containing protein [Mailhella sp.]|nr:ATP-binding cassette domain-containing protein [Mailhella sp.]
MFCLKADALSVGLGQTWGIIGPSGCGKSTLLEMLALLARPDEVSRFSLYDASGEIVSIDELWRKNDYDRLATLRRNNFGFVHQAGNLFPFLSVRENILIPYRLRFGTGGEQRLLELADILGITRLLDHKPEQLSYGERQRAAIARALIHSPRLVLADEPTSALDPETARQVMTLFRRCVEHTDTALLLVSHDHALLRDSSIPTLEVRREDAGLDTSGGTCWTLTPSSRIDMEEPTAECAVSTPSRTSSSGMLSLFMAWKDFLHEHLLSFCGILAFASALTPILLLAGLRFGIVDTLSQRLLNSPATLSITPYGSVRFTQERLAELASHPSVSFLVARTRTLAASVNLVGAKGKRLSADLVPTAEGDPLLGYADITFSEKGVVITRQLERSLSAVEGECSLELFVSRMHGGRLERVSVSVPVLGVLPDSADWKSHIYAPLSFTEAVERYRDGFSVPEFGWTGKEGSPERTYAGFRMYVKSLDDVVVMRDFLMREGIESYTSAREVENIQALKRTLSFVTILIGGVTIVGMMMSLASFSVSNVNRKEHFFAQARLMGFSGCSLLLFPVGQMILCAICASSLSLLFYGGAAVIFDVVCASYLQHGESICRIPAIYTAMLYSGALILSLICCVGAGRKLLRLQPAEVLRRHV